MAGPGATTDQSPKISGREECSTRRRLSVSKISPLPKWRTFQMQESLTNLDGTDLRQVGGTRSKLNRDLAVSHGDRESLVDGSERSPRRGNDVKVGQHRRAVDRHIEDASAGGGKVELGELQSDIIAAVRDGKLIGEVTVALRLVELGVGRVRNVAGRASGVPTNKAGIRAPDLRKSVRISRTAGMYEDRAERRNERDGSAGSLRGVCYAGSSDVHCLRCGDGRRCGVETGCRSRSDKRSDLRTVGPSDTKVGSTRNRCCKLLTLRGKQRRASRAGLDADAGIHLDLDRANLRQVRRSCGELDFDRTASYRYREGSINRGE